MVEEFTPFSFHISPSVQGQYLHDLTQAGSPFVDLSSYPHQTIKPASIKPSHGLPHLSFSCSLSTRFLKPLLSPVVPAVVPLCKRATHSLPFQCLRSLLPSVSFSSPCARAVFARFDSGEIAFRRSFELSKSDYIAIGAFLSED